MDSDDVLLGVFVLGIVLFLLGLIVAVGGGIGTGLMIMGGGCILSGIGGSVSFKVQYTVTTGTTGAVLLLVGAFFDYFSNLMGQ